MSLFSKSLTVISRAAAVLLLPLLAWSCQGGSDDMGDAAAHRDAAQYINLTISVSAGNENVTRANPNGGEEGDGRERGIDTRENEVEGVTVIFYRNADGINATDESAAATPIDFVAYYPTTLADGYTPATGTHYADEVYYTTGDQALPTPLKTDQQYYVIVVANADLTSEITAASTKLSTVRDMVRTELYKGTGINASKFVMTSERDDVINFSSSYYDSQKNSITFRFDNIHIERMAARIDFLASGAAYDATTYDHAGYVYSVGSSTDHFVLTSIEPFNLNNGNEYLIKRTNDASPYLADETLTNWVVDANTAENNKTDAAHPTYLTSTLTTVAANTGALAMTMSSQQSNKLSLSGSDDIIIAYPKENTINAATPYYYYATGLAFEGYYYKNGATTGGERRVYYHFLRHQGEASAAYDAIPAASLSSYKDKTIGTSGTPMNFGIVRNNIYRVSIAGITADTVDDIKLTLHIKVKKWDVFEHDTIYM